MGALRRMAQKNQQRSKLGRSRQGLGNENVGGMFGSLSNDAAPASPKVPSGIGGGVGGGHDVASPNHSSQGSAPTVPSLMPHHDEVLSAVESLYADELKPFGRILRKRIAERSVGKACSHRPETALPDVDIKHLRSVCHASDQLHIVPEEGGDWSAMVIGREPCFVNVYSPKDLYPAKLWEQATAYFEGLTGDDMCLPGGRYSCAQALKARNLPFLAGRSLGQVCHIVQLAISQKRILGYYSGDVVPYSRSQSMVKEWCAFKGTPCTSQAQTTTTGTTGGPIPLATWEQARSNLRLILQSAATPHTPGMVPLSNVKRLFRSRFQVELSETMLGYSKLSELLQDQRFHDICKVQLQGHGYIVVANTTVLVPTPPSVAVPSTLSLAMVLPQRGMGDASPLRNKEPARVELDDNSPLRRAMERSNSPLGFGDASPQAQSTPHMPASVFPPTPDMSPVRTRYVWGRNGNNVSGAAGGFFSMLNCDQTKEEIKPGSAHFEATCRALNSSLRGMGLRASEDNGEHDDVECHVLKRSSDAESTTNDVDSHCETASPSRSSRQSSGQTEGSRSEHFGMASPASPAVHGNPMKIYLGRSHDATPCSNAGGDESPYGGDSENSAFVRTPSPSRNRYLFSPQQPRQLDVESVEIFGAAGASALPPPLPPPTVFQSPPSVGVSPVAAAVAAASGGPRWESVSPTRLSKNCSIGAMVQQSCIQAPVEETAEVPLSARSLTRSHSVPTTFGANKDFVENARNALTNMQRVGDVVGCVNSGCPHPTDAVARINFGQTPSPLMPSLERAFNDYRDVSTPGGKERSMTYSAQVPLHQVLHLSELI